MYSYQFQSLVEKFVQERYILRGRGWKKNPLLLALAPALCVGKTVQFLK